MARFHLRRLVALAAAVFLVSTSAGAMASEEVVPTASGEGAAAAASTASSPAASSGGDSAKSDSTTSAGSAKGEPKPEAKDEPKPEAKAAATAEAATEATEPTAAALGAEDPVEATAVGDDAASLPVTVPPGLDDGRIFPVVSNTPDGVAVLVGGSSDPGQGAPNNDTWIFEGGAWLPVCGTTVAGADSPCALPARSGGALGTAPGGVIMFGGHPGSQFGPSGPPLSDTWLFDGASWQQVCAEGACGPEARSMAAIAGNSAMTLMFGGLTGGFSSSLEDTWMFDGSTWTQLCGISMGVPCGPSARFWSSMTWDGTNFVLFGGMQGDFANGSTAMGDTWIWTGTSWQLVCASGACGPAPRGNAAFPTMFSPDPALAGAFLAGGLDLVFGGSGVNTAYRDLWFWSAQDLAFRQLTSPWGPNLSWTGNGAPPADGLPLGFAGAATDDCQVVFYGTNLGDQGTGESNVSTLSGWDNGQGRPATCAEQEIARGGGGRTNARLVAYELEGGLPVTGGSPWVQMSAGGLLALIGICFLLAYRRRVLTTTGA